MAASQIVVAFRGVGDGRQTYTKEEALVYLVQETLRAVRKIANSGETRRGPQAVARRDGCKECAKILKAGKVPDEYRGESNLIDLDLMTAAEFDKRINETGDSDFEFDSIMAEISAVQEG
jgi:hypothetical protein